MGEPVDYPNTGVQSVFGNTGLKLREEAEAGDRDLVIINVILEPC